VEDRVSRIRVLVVDDSVVARRVVVESLSHDPGIDVVGTAANGRVALTMVERLAPDVVTMDMEMPLMDGIEAVRAMRRRGDRCRVIMFTRFSAQDAKRTFAALAAGANDYVTKPSSMMSAAASIGAVAETLVPKIKALAAKAGAGKMSGNGSGASGASSTEVIHLAARPHGPARPVRVVVIGSSMGGSEALLHVLRSITRLPVPIVLVQHMAPLFTRQMADWLDLVCASTVLEPKGGEELLPGHVYVAPGGHHLELRGTARGARIVLRDSPPVNSCRPSVDTLFRSASAVYGTDLLAVVLTGMGSDGLAGSAAVIEAGGTVLVQDEASSLVWGMPGAVAKAGFAHRVVPLDEIGAAIAAEVQSTNGDLASSAGGA
jgi:two-component system, chemotaxis family, protein-glutamate methylesterase/glutaminase